MNDHLPNTAPNSAHNAADAFTSSNKPSPLTIWWKTIRPATLWAGASPVLVGAGLASYNQIEWGTSSFSP